MCRGFNRWVLRAAHGNAARCSGDKVFAMQRDELEKELVTQDIGTEEAFSLTSISQRLFSSSTTGTVSKLSTGGFRSGIMLLKAVV